MGLQQTLKNAAYTCAILLSRKNKTIKRLFAENGAENYSQKGLRFLLKWKKRSSVLNNVLGKIIVKKNDDADKKIFLNHLLNIKGDNYNIENGIKEFLKNNSRIFTQADFERIRKTSRNYYVQENVECCLKMGHYWKDNTSVIGIPLDVTILPKASIRENQTQIHNTEPFEVNKEKLQPEITCKKTEKERRNLWEQRRNSKVAKRSMVASEAIIPKSKSTELFNWLANEKSPTVIRAFLNREDKIVENLSNKRLLTLLINKNFAKEYKKLELASVLKKLPMKKQYQRPAGRFADRIRAR